MIHERKRFRYEVVVHRLAGPDRCRLLSPGRQAAHRAGGADEEEADGALVNEETGSWETTTPIVSHLFPNEARTLGPLVPGFFLVGRAG